MGIGAVPIWQFLNDLLSRTQPLNRLAAWERWPFQYVAVLELDYDNPEIFYLNDFLELTEFLKWVDQPLRLCWLGVELNEKGLEIYRQEVAKCGKPTIALERDDAIRRQREEDLARHRAMWLEHCKELVGAA